MRREIIAGNWKMNFTADQTASFLKDVKAELGGLDKVVLFCVPYTDILAAVEAVKGTDIQIGAQNMHYEASGAYTGEISAEMLLEAGVTYVIIGHSERRSYYNETDEGVNKKVRRALEVGLNPIMCCGETLQQREEGVLKEVIRTQIVGGFAGIAAADAKKVIVAYEPIWAIGTGVTATDEQAEEMCAFIRQVLCELYGDVSEEISILYGGSVNEKNAKSLMSMPNIDGGLVGGASLKPSFVQVVNYE